MEILIRLAGVQLGPYSEAQIRQHLTDGLLSLTDLAKVEGSEEWASLAEVLAKVTRESRVLPRMELAAATVPLPGSRRANDPEPVAPAPPAPISAPTPEPGLAPIAETSPEAEPVAAAESESVPEPAPIGEPEPPRRAPTAPPGVSHLPTRVAEEKEPDISPVTDPAPVALERKTMLLGPTAPGAPLVLPPSAGNTLTTSPLLGTVQKKTSRAALVKSLSNKTSPLPTTAITTPWRPPSAAPEEAPTTPLPKHTEAKNESAARSIQAKTVPMHKAAPSTPPTPVHPSTIATTTPMSTRPVNKPATPPTDLPEVPGKKMDRMILPDSGPIAQPTPLSKDDRKKLASLKKSEAEMSREDGEDPTSTKRPPRRILPLLICLTAVMAVAVPYYVWSPYHSAAQLHTTLVSGDPADLDAMIDFESVRALLKAQIQVELGAKDSAIVSKVLPMLDDSIDHYVTAEGISALVTKQKQEQKSNGDVEDIIAPNVAGKLLGALEAEPARREGLSSLVDFVMDRDVVLLHLRYQFLRWKLKRVDLELSALSAAAGTTSPLLTPVVATYIARGDAMAKKGQWSEAATEYTRVLSIDPKSSAAHNARGMALQAKGDLDGAILDFTQSIEIDPQNATAYNDRGSARYAKNDQDGAIADFTQAIRIDPMLATAYDSRGNSKAYKNDFEGAIADYTQAITIDPSKPQAYSDRGFARQANGNADGAIADYTAALALNPKSDIAYYNRGLARQTQGNLDAAITDFDHALDFNPNIAPAYYYRGNAKSANHDLDGAIADYTKALALTPNLVQAYTNRGLARREKGDLDGAKADFTSALGLDPKQAAAYFNRAQIKAQKNDLDGAIADSSQALDLDPKNAAALYTRGFAKLAKGNLDGAMADLKQFCGLSSRERDADHARIYLWLIAKAQGVRSDGDPDQDLSQALQGSWNSTPDDVVTKTANFLLGRTAEPDYLAGAASSDAKLDQLLRCQAWYFAGVKRLLTGDKAGAADAFHKSIATGQKDATEFLLASEELAGLEPASAPAPAPVSPPPSPAPAPNP